MEVLFPFGHGLSYTSYDYSDLKLSSSKILDTDTLEVSVKVTNTGKMAGKEIVQLYVSEKTGTREIRPVKELKGFMKVHLEPGESKTVKFSLDKRSFAFYNMDIHDWYAPTGEYEILIGASSKDIRLTAGLELTSTVKGVFVVGENTVLQEVMEHPVASKIARPLIDAYLKGQNDGERSETAKSTVSDEMIWAMMCSMPLRALRSFAQMSDEEVAQFIAKINEELMK